MITSQGQSPDFKHRAVICVAAVLKVLSWPEYVTTGVRVPPLAGRVQKEREEREKIWANCLRRVFLRNLLESSVLATGHLVRPVFILTDRMPRSKAGLLFLRIGGIRSWRAASRFGCGSLPSSSVESQPEGVTVGPSAQYRTLFSSPRADFLSVPPV